MNTFDDLIDWITPQFASSQTRLTESAGAQAPKRDWNNLDAFVFSDFWELQRRDFIGWESVMCGRKKGIACVVRKDDNPKETRESIAPS